jgi:hypothetical protein
MPVNAILGRGANILQAGYFRLQFVPGGEMYSDLSYHGGLRARFLIFNKPVEQVYTCLIQLNGRHASTSTDARYEPRCQSARKLDASPVRPVTSASRLRCLETLAPLLLSDCWQQFEPMLKGDKNS